MSESGASSRCLLPVPSPLGEEPVASPSSKHLTATPKFLAQKILMTKPEKCMVLHFLHKFILGLPDAQHRHDVRELINKVPQALSL
jgi:hypothetical protein